MNKHPFDGPVSELLRQTANEIIMPRFRTLAEHEIKEKSPGELVTIADTESEDRLSEGLATILPEARIVGEEATAADPALLNDLGNGTIWLIDPIDGTTNFSEGTTPFGIMIALVTDGETEAGWLYNPVTNRLCHAHRRNGAYVDGEPIAGRTTGQTPPVAALAMHFLPPERRADLEERAKNRLTVVPIPRCAAEQYPRLALGENDISLFERTLPWDHAPGALFLEEAGGKTARPNGDRYRAVEMRPGLLSAATPELWDIAAEVLVN